MVFVSLESSLLNSVLVCWGIFNQNFGWISIHATNCIYQLFCSLTFAVFAFSFDNGHELVCSELSSVWDAPIRDKYELDLNLGSENLYFSQPNMAHESSPLYTYNQVWGYPYPL